MDRETVDRFLGDHTSGMYGVAMFITDMMFKKADKGIKGAILHGVTSSGKSTLCNYIGEIYSSYAYDEREGDFDQPIDKEDCYVQVLVMQEVTMSKLLAKSKVNKAKILFEGGGKIVNAKNQ